MMKIAHVTSSLSQHGAGVRAVVENLARAQQTEGNNVGVFGLTDSAFSETEYADWEGLHVEACKVIGPTSVGFAPSMTRALELWQPDVVHLHGLWMYPARAVLNWHRCTGRPYIISVHGMLSEVALSYSPVKKRIARGLFQDAAFAGATCFQATSASECEEIRAFGLKNPTVLIPNGVSKADVPPSDKPEGIYSILSLGRIHRQKGLDVLIDAWAQLEQEFDAWRLRLVGPDEKGYTSELEQRILQYGLTRCSIEGPVFGNARNQLMANSDLFVLPSRGENFALTVAESLMMVVPVISSIGAPWQGLEAEDCGLWVPLNARDLADAMRALMILPSAERRAMGQRGRAWMLRAFSWETIGQQTIETYAWMRGEGTAPTGLLAERAGA